MLHAMHITSHLLVMLLPFILASNVHIVMKMGDPKMPVPHKKHCKPIKGLSRE
jgi:hypothetical protein